MPWQIKRTNTDKGEITQGPANFGTFEVAFRQAMNDAMDFITDHWDTGTGADVDGPSDTAKFKIYINRRDVPPHIRMTYGWVDSTQPVGQQGQSNDLFWEFIEV